MCMSQECDDGNQNSCDGCNNQCLEERCGNGIIDCSEVPDDLRLAC